MAVPRTPVGTAATTQATAQTTAQATPEAVDDDDVESLNHESQDNVLARALEALEEARAEIRNQRAVIVNLERSRTHTPAVEPIREPKVSTPDEFAGKISEYRTFMSQCLLNFAMSPSRYPDDERKVLFVVSYLRGNARDWARPILDDEKHPYRNDFAAFKKVLDTLYLDRNLKHQARDKLSRLKQTKSAAAYSVEFQQIIAPLNLNDEGKHILFYLGLKDTIKDALATIKEEETFHPLVDQVIAIDQRQHQRRMEDKKSSSAKPHETTSMSKSAGKKPVSKEQPKHSSPQPSSQPRGPLSKEEKARRRNNNLCYRCASPDHKAHACPLRNASSSSMSAPITIVPEYSPPKLVQGNWPSQGT